MFLNSTANYPSYYLERQLSIFSVGYSAKSTLDYSRTNVQVEGIDEADIVKCDGSYIYIVRDNHILIVRGYPPETAHFLANITVNGTIVGIFINNDRLVVLESNYEKFSSRASEKIGFLDVPFTHILIYDVADRERPSLVKKISCDGSYFASRMIGDYMYLITSRGAYRIGEDVPLPTVIKDGELEEIDARDIYYVDVADYSYQFVTVLSVNIKNESISPSHQTLLVGYSSGIYVSLNNIYLATSHYIPKSYAMVTEVYRIKIDGELILPEANGNVLGRILNQFSMDEYGGFFRIATTTGDVWNGISGNNVYVLDMNLTIIGRLENLAIGETIYSARFMGDKCYLVTFKKVDPLFVISLEDPANPRILGQLKIPGYSNYLHPYGQTLLIGIGKETEDAEQGDFAWYQGVKISLFDISDVENPLEIAKYEIGHRGTESPVLHDHKALLFDADRQLLVIPILLAEVDEKKFPSGVPPYVYGDYTWQGVYVFTTTENNVVVRGRITHLENNQGYLDGDRLLASRFSVERAIYIENFLYTISKGMIKINSLDNLEDVNRIYLP
ncbi:MAG: beta-propeller domain-containing protein [Nitrososphaerota archaeon]|nr:beta-propeller domain-containing protein [Candidatus Bathyarchaeota archaeon]MDW8048627.1 beta-propeller domain-containing protein [Nitrososphaerota archaeon]